MTQGLVKVAQKTDFPVSGGEVEGRSTSDINERIVWDAVDSLLPGPQWNLTMAKTG